MDAQTMMEVTNGTIQLATIIAVILLGFIAILAIVEGRDNNNRRKP